MEPLSINALQLITGVILGVLISLAAWRVGALSPSGAAAASLTGALIFGLGGLPWAVLLLLFFTSSTALSRAFGSRKKKLVEKFSKGSRRDWGQVFANGGLGGILVVIQALLPGQAWPWIAYAGAMAAVNADTWATELGVLNPTSPRLITTWKPVEKGASGAVSLTGSLAALAGAALVSLAGALFSSSAGVQVVLLFFLSAVGAGFIGAAVDSLLGALVQAIYWCPSCLKETERHPLHTCGSPTTLMRGLPWLNNDWVNFACGLAGAVSAVVLFRLFTFLAV